MASSITKACVTNLIQGLQKHNIDFVLSDVALGCPLTEVYITQVQELILFPPKQIDSATLQWILEIRTPLKVRLTFFSEDLTNLKLQLTRALSTVQKNGLPIPNLGRAISIQELSKENIQRLLESLENWVTLSANGRPLPAILPEKNEGSNPPQLEHKDLHVHLRNAIKTYWTERYLARYLNTPIENVKKITKKIGIQREVCGREILYFFERSKALSTYFTHIVKGILTELELQFKETLTHEFYLPDLQLGLYFFDGEIDQLQILAGECATNHDLIIVVPEPLRRNIGRIQDAFFQILPLDQERIKSTLKRTVQQRLHYIPAYSSGITK
jgi:hypothetical protein